MHTVVYDGVEFSINQSVHQAMGLGRIGVFNRVHVNLDLVLNNDGEKLPSELFQQYIKFCELYSETKQFLPDLEPGLWVKERARSKAPASGGEEEEGETEETKLERTQVPDIADKFPYQFATFVEDHGDDGLTAVTLFGYELANFEVVSIAAALIARRPLAARTLTPDYVREMFGITNKFTEEEKNRIRLEHRWITGDVEVVPARRAKVLALSVMEEKQYAHIRQQEEEMHEQLSAYRQAMSTPKQRTSAPQAKHFARASRLEKRRLRLMDPQIFGATVAANPRDPGTSMAPKMFGYAFKKTRYTKETAYEWLRRPVIWKESIGAIIYLRDQKLRGGDVYLIFGPAQQGRYDTGLPVSGSPGVYKLVKKNVE